jgi:hypothetical protein
MENHDRSGSDSRGKGKRKIESIALRGMNLIIIICAAFQLAWILLMLISFGIIYIAISMPTAPAAAPRPTGTATRPAPFAALGFEPGEAPPVGMFIIEPVISGIPAMPDMPDMPEPPSAPAGVGVGIIIPDIPDIPIIPIIPASDWAAA